MALYATCMPLPSDTFHDKLFACDQGGHPDYDHDREEVLWLLLAALFSLRLGLIEGQLHLGSVPIPR